MSDSTSVFDAINPSDLPSKSERLVPKTHEQQPDEHLDPEELDRLTHKMIALFNSVYDPDLLDPLRYIHEGIRKIVDGSDAPEELKNRINGKTPIIVSHRHRPSATGGLIDAGAFLGPREKKTFTLDEIVTQSYLRQLSDHLQLRIDWPEDFPTLLINAFESANLQASYQSDVQRRLSTPDAQLMLKLQAEIEVKNRLDQYAKNANTPQDQRDLIDAYGRGEVKLQRVEFRTRIRHIDVTQTVYLPPLKGTSTSGLLVFLDAQTEDAIVALPRSNRRWFIESNARLRRLVLERLPLYEQLRKGHDKLAYTIFFTAGFVTSSPPLAFCNTDDIFQALYNMRIKRMLSDIDTLVSTDTERLTDQLLAIGASLLQGLSIVVTLPIGGSGSLAARLLVSFLLGQGSAAMQAIRGALADIPEEADKHYKAALFAAIAEVVGPLASKTLGRTLSAANTSKITTRVFRYIRKTGRYPGRSAENYNRIKPEPSEVKRIKGQVSERFSEGPEQAQSFVNKGGRLLNKTVEGHNLVVYQGRVFRGDMRPPEEIFEKGFQLRTPAAQIQKDIHQVTGVRGGFGGGHDALDIDGRGISTSVYYRKDGAGAYYYGGHKGGHTYLIDARKFDGYHLYQNYENALHPNVAKRIQYKPIEINYAHGIPGTAVLGAYDSAGRFIANNVALRIHARELAVKELRRHIAATIAAATKDPVQPSQ